MAAAPRPAARLTDGRMVETGSHEAEGGGAKEGRKEGRKAGRGDGGSEEAGDKKNGRTDMAAAARASGSGSPHSALDISGNVIDVFDVSFL